MTTERFVSRELEAVGAAFARLARDPGPVAAAAAACVAAIRRGGKVMFCGNGGSAADAQHLAAELVGRYKLDRAALPALSLTVDTSVLTAVANDYGFETVFERQVEALGETGDVLVGLSTSGNSPDVVRAFAKADEMGVETIALTGADGGAMAKAADIVVAVPATETNHIQELHIAVGHLVCGLVEAEICGKGKGE